LADDKEDTPIMQSEHYTLGVLFAKNKFQLEVEAYHKRMANLASFSPIFLDNFQDEEYAEGTGKVWGIDLMLQRKWKHYQTWVSYTYSRIFYTFAIYNNNEPFPAPHDRPHVLTFMHQWNIAHWAIAVSWKYASGKTFTAPSSILMEEDLVVPQYDYQDTNDERLPQYHRLDASILYQFNGKNEKWRGKFGLSFLNLYNRQNLLSRQFFVFEDEEEYFLDQLDRSMLRFTPNLVFRLSWN
ncbi:MAG: TonB-dependent receptor, partial [Bacteroidota bacterium]